MKSERWAARVKGRIDIDPSRYVEINGEKLQDADFSGRRLLWFRSIDSRFENCRFDDMYVESAYFGAGRKMSEYVDCSFNGLTTESLIGDSARFVRCSFRDVRLKHWRCFTTELMDCTFSGELRGCIFNGTVPDLEWAAAHPSLRMRLRGRFMRWSLPQTDRSILRRQSNEFHGNDFSAAKLIDVAFRTGVDLSRQKLPKGSEYILVEDAADALYWAKARLELTNESEERRLGLELVEHWLAGVRDGQRQLFLQRATYEHPAHVAVIELLSAHQSE